MVCLILGWFSCIIFPKLYQANCPRPFTGLSGAFIPKHGKKQCVSEVDFNELKQQSCCRETWHWYYFGVTLWELLHWFAESGGFKLQDCVLEIQVLKEKQFCFFLKTDFLWLQVSVFNYLHYWYKNIYNIKRKQTIFTSYFLVKWTKPILISSITYQGFFWTGYSFIA